MTIQDINLDSLKSSCTHFDGQQRCGCLRRCKFVAAVALEAEQNRKLEVKHYAVEGNNWLAGILAIATGIEPEEVIMRLGDKIPTNGFYSGQVADMLRELGYDCSPDFKQKFDPATERICLMRYTFSARYWVKERQRIREKTENPKKQLPKSYKKWWSIFVYYNGLVYSPYFSEAFPLESRLFTENYRATRMMQVWLSNR